jgi:hypothetical protein
VQIHLGSAGGCAAPVSASRLHPARQRRRRNLCARCGALVFQMKLTSAPCMHRDTWLRLGGCLQRLQSRARWSWGVRAAVYSGAPRLRWRDETRQRGRRGGNVPVEWGRWRGFLARGCQRSFLALRNLGGSAHQQFKRWKCDNMCSCRTMGVSAGLAPPKSKTLPRFMVEAAAHQTLHGCGARATRRT